MFHLNHFEQHQAFYGPKCDETCVVCNGLDRDESSNTAALNSAKPGDIFNVSATTLNQSMLTDLSTAKTKRLHTRLWWSHRVDQLNSDQVCPLLDEVLLWCPAPEKEAFNERCGREFFDEFKVHVKALKPKITLVFPIRQYNIEELPEFYDLVDECRTEGMILYCPKNFSREERRYIQRFKRVPRMRIMPMKDQPIHLFMGVPNTMGSFRFEWRDWQHAVRMTLRRWPLIKYTI